MGKEAHWNGRETEANFGRYISDRGGKTGTLLLYQIAFRHARKEEDNRNGGEERTEFTADGQCDKANCSVSVLSVCYLVLLSELFLQYLDNAQLLLLHRYDALFVRGRGPLKCNRERWVVWKDMRTVAVVVGGHKAN